jgi:hypothetical protein
MISLKTIIIASVVISLGWLTGRMIHTFVNFIMDAIEKHNKENRDE